MNTVKAINLISIITLLSLLGNPAQAKLIDRGNGLIYDSILKITWLQDANYAQTSEFDNDGLMTWNKAVSWADGLDYAGYDDWRLPSMAVSWGLPTGVITWGNYEVSCWLVSEEVCKENELGYLFRYNLDGHEFDSITGDQGFFKNIKEEVWSGTRYQSGPPLLFDFGYGHVGIVVLDGVEAVPWAVRDGDVTAVPLPPTIALLGLGLCILTLTGRRQRNDRRFK